MVRPEEDTSKSRYGTQPTQGDRDRACLIVIRGLNVGEMYKLSRSEVIIGRGQQADVEILDDGISRRHAKISFRSDDTVEIEDLGSRNGTYLNGQRVEKTSEIHDGDKIQLSSTTILKFTYADRLDESFQRRMYESALRDGLTKAFNKKYFLDRLEREFRFAKRHKQPLTLVMFDVDHFKEVNEKYGHVAGDYVLTALAMQVHHAIRTEDVFARYGGEEFAVICRATDLAGAVSFAERLRAQVADFNFVFEHELVPITISVGVAALTNDQNDSMALLQAADDALYVAKRGGRNLVYTAGTPKPPEKDS
jgi:diguanylate cyclase (GGDEF)-like protein